MSSAPILQLPMLLTSQAQAQQHLTRNQALLVLDAIVQAAVLSRSLVDPPADPSDGDRYIIGDSAEGDRSGRDRQISVTQNGALFYLRPDCVGGSLLRTRTSW